MREDGPVEHRRRALTSGEQVVAILVCHDGAQWLPDVLVALRQQTVIPAVIVAVDTGSVDGTADLLSAAVRAGQLAEVVTRARDTGFGAAVADGLARARGRHATPGRWVWVLHDDSAPGSSCLASLLAAVDVSPSVGIVGPLALDWDDPRLVVEAGLSTDASGRLQTGIGSDELDDGQFFQTTEVLAVSSAGALISASTWDALGGYDARLPMFVDDLDLGWRAQRCGKLVLCVPAARVRHVRAGSRGLRVLDALGDSLGAELPAGRTGARYAERAHGLRTFLANTSAVSYRLGLIRLTVLAAIRAVVLLVARDRAGAGLEWRALAWAVGPTADLAAARAARATTFTVGPAAVRGLLTSRLTRMRNALRGGFVGLARSQARAELALGRLPEGASLVAQTAPGRPAQVLERTPALAPLATAPLATAPLGTAPLATAPLATAPLATAPLATAPLATAPPAPSEHSAPRVEAVGRHRAPDAATGLVRARRVGLATPAGALPPATSPARVVAGLRRPVRQVAIAAPVDPAVLPAPPARAPSPFSRDPLVAAARARAEAERADALDREPGGVGERVMLVVRVGAAQVTRRLVLSPPVLLAVALTVLSLVIHRARLGLQVSGGGLLPVDTGSRGLLAWYVAGWHAVAGGTAAPAPAVAGLLGLLGLPLGGADHAVAVLVLAAMPLAGIGAYLATGRCTVPRSWRAGLAAGWALLPVAVAGVAQGRLDTTLAHILIPVLLAGLVRLLRGPRVHPVGASQPAWVAPAAGTALALAAVASASPLLYVLVVLAAVVGLVALRPGTAGGRARGWGVSVVVVTPMALLMPWPIVLLRLPSVVLHGVGSVVTGRDASGASQATLAGTAAGTGSAAGVLLVTAAIVALLVAFDRAMVAGLVLAGFGWAAAVLLGAVRAQPLAGGDPVAGSTGPALLFTAAGLGVVVLAGVHRVYASPGSTPRRRVPARAATVLGAGALLALVGGAASAGSAGTVVAGRPATLPAELRTDLLSRQALVLTLGAAGSPVRLSAPELPRLGEDDLVAVPGAVSRLTGWASALLGADAVAARAAVAQAAASGVGAVVLGQGQQLAGPILAAGGLTEAGATSDGRQVLRVLAAAAGAQLLEPQLAVSAQAGADPPANPGAAGVLAVPGAPPQLGVAVSAGSQGRLLVLAAEDEPGWRVRVDGQTVDPLRAYGHLVAVAVPATPSEVTVDRSSTLRSLLLLVQGALLVFTAFLAVPPRRRQDR